MTSWYTIHGMFQLPKETSTFQDVCLIDLIVKKLSRGFLWNSNRIHWEISSKKPYS